MVLRWPRGLDVTQARSGCAGQCLHGPDLIDHVSGQFGRGHIDPPAAEPGEVEVADLRADPHTALLGGQAGRASPTGFPAGNRRPGLALVTISALRRRHRVPRPRNLREVGIEIDGDHDSTLGPPGRRRPRSGHRPDHVMRG